MTLILTESFVVSRPIFTMARIRIQDPVLIKIVFKPLCLKSIFDPFSGDGFPTDFWRRFAVLRFLFPPAVSASTHNSSVT